MRHLLFGLVFWGVSLAAAEFVQATEQAAGVIPRIDQRFAAATEESPDFQRHLVPMLSKIGCNGRSCHGSFQGRGGFQLSLFGYDFKMDHQGLSERIDVDEPLESYALQKATLREPHEGGQKILPDSWEYQVLLNWIENGAVGTEKEHRLKTLEITPSEIQFQGEGESRQLQVVAVWEDGLREDVTPLCRFQSNDTSIATVDSAGRVTSATPGDTHVVVFYDNGTVPVPIVQPVSDLTGARYPQVATPTQIDHLVVQKLQKLGIVPAETCDDSDFLRRVTLDITGTLPSPQQVREFLADPRTDKRSRKIDELLETPAYAAWWATRFNDYTGNGIAQLNNVSYNNNQVTQEWYEWVRKRIAENQPYDEIVRGIVLAKSQREDETYEEYSERMTEYFLDKSGQKFAEQDSLPYYWARRNFQKLEDRVIGFAYTFLGIRIQCAQCHKHPFDQWTQQDFVEFQPLFSKTRFSPFGGNRQEYDAMLASLEVDENLRGNQLRQALARIVQKGEVVPFPAIIQTGSRNGRRMNRNTQREIPARVLGGETFDMNQYEDPREALMAWLSGGARDLFAKAFVNRVWANYFSRGIVEPTDDLSLANPPTNQALLDYLTSGFIQHDFDMKWLHREICNSRTYQLSWRTNETNRLDERNFSRAIPRRLPAEVAYDALFQATANTPRNQQWLTNLSSRAIAIPGTAQGRGGNNYALVIFGKSARENNCDCERSSEPTLLQTLFLNNDAEFLSAMDSRTGWLSELAHEWNLPLQASLAVAEKPQRPDNSTEIVERIQKQLQRAKKQGNEEQAERLKQRLKTYKAMYALQNNKQQMLSDNRDLPDKTSFSVQDAVEEAYLRTLGRFPSEEELQIAEQAISGAETPVEGMRDVLWALLNTKEFILNH